MALPCSPWSSLSNMKPEWKRQQDRKDALPMLRFCMRLAWYQIQHGRYFVIENPETSQLWTQKDLLELCESSNVTWGVTDMCMHGLADPKTNDRYHKSVCLMHNFPTGIFDPVFKRCDNSHNHQVVIGRLPDNTPRSIMSQIYPWRFCRLISKLIVQILSSSHSHLVHERDICEDTQSLYVDTEHMWLIDDLLTMSDFTTS